MKVKPFVWPHFQNRIERVSWVWSNDERGVCAAHLDQRPQVFSPNLLAGVVDVVAVADYGHRHAGKLLDDVLEGIFFMVFPPRCDGTAERMAELLNIHLKKSRQERPNTVIEW